MPMVAAGVIADDPTLQPIRRLVSLVRSFYYLARFDLLHGLIFAAPTVPGWWEVDAPAHSYNACLSTITCLLRFVVSLGLCFVNSFTSSPVLQSLTSAIHVVTLTFHLSD